MVVPQESMVAVTSVISMLAVAVAALLLPENTVAKRSVENPRPETRSEPSAQENRKLAVPDPVPLGHGVSANGVQVPLEPSVHCGEVGSMSTAAVTASQAGAGRELPLGLLSSEAERPDVVYGTDRSTDEAGGLKGMEAASEAPTGFCPHGLVCDRLIGRRQRRPLTDCP
jgi:hypothetical protein